MVKPVLCGDVKDLIAHVEGGIAIEVQYYIFSVECILQVKGSDRLIR